MLEADTSSSSSSSMSSLTGVYAKSAATSLLVSYLVLVWKTRVVLDKNIPWPVARTVWHKFLAPLVGTVKVAACTPLLPVLYAANMIRLKERTVTLHSVGFCDVLNHPRQETYCCNATPDVSDLIIEF